MKIFKYCLAAEQLWLLGFALAVPAAVPLITGPLLLANGQGNETGILNRFTPVSLKIPPEPSDFKILGTSITIQFYAYGLELDVEDGSNLIEHAILITIDHQPVWHQAIHDDLLMDGDFGIEFRFYPHNGVTWGDWYKVALAIKIFFSQYLKAEFSFRIMLEGRPAASFGHGLMREKPR